MGCTSSTPTVDPVAKKRAEQQRRRLSVAPGQVGDITVDSKGNDVASPISMSPSAAVDIGKDGDFKHADLSKKGFVPYNRTKKNQDRAIAEHINIDGTPVYIFGVFDGHGEVGHIISEYVLKNLSGFLKKQGDRLLRDTENAIIDGVDELARELKRSSINAAFSGTTAVFSVIIGKDMYTANIGDSRGVKCIGKSKDDWNVQALSFDHKPDNPEEMKRILAAGGRVQPLPGLPDEDRGPHRVWLQDVDVPGLAMSRSIGDDVSHTVGVLHTPEVIKTTIGEDDLFCVWGSDGVWEFISNEDACKYVIDLVQKGDLAGAVTLLVKKSTECWKRHEEVIDDITAVILKLRDF